MRDGGDKSRQSVPRLVIDPVELLLGTFSSGIARIFLGMAAIALAVALCWAMCQIGDAGNESLEDFLGYMIFMPVAWLVVLEPQTAWGTAVLALASVLTFLILLVSYCALVIDASPKLSLFLVFSTMLASGMAAVLGCDGNWVLLLVAWVALAVLYWTPAVIVRVRNP